MREEEEENANGCKVYFEGGDKNVLKLSSGDGLQVCVQP